MRGTIYRKLALDLLTRRLPVLIDFLPYETRQIPSLHDRQSLEERAVCFRRVALQIVEQVLNVIWWQVCLYVRFITHKPLEFCIPSSLG